MQLPAVLTRLFGRPDPDEALEDAQAATLDANVARLRSTDPDTARIFPAGAFTAARHDRAASDRLAQQLQEYAETKYRQGREHLYGALFAGLDD